MRSQLRRACAAGARTRAERDDPGPTAVRPEAEDVHMRFLLSLSRLIDAVNERIGHVVYWFVLAMVLVSAANAVSRYALNIASNAWLELQWYLFAGVFLLCSGYTLLHNEHIRIDVIASHLSRRAQIWIDILGTLFFMLPVTAYIAWLSWPVFMNAWTSGEISMNAGGLIRWPARLLVPMGFFLLTLQGLSELVKRVAYLRGLIPDPVEKHADPALEQLQVDEDPGK
jgi:TRAP-type mannitol/chloroaromatic compound transport system permease small subunit